MIINWKEITLEDKQMIEGYLHTKPMRCCDLTFANIYLWKRQYPTTYAIVEGALVFHPANSEKPEFSYPFGEDEQVKACIEHLQQIADELHQPLQLFLASEDDFAQIEQWFPGSYGIHYQSGYEDYVYETEKLITLSGKKYHGKKNHVNRFQKNYPDWSYETITAENLDECFQMAMRWRQENGCETDPEKRAEMCVTMNALRLMDELSLSGGLIRAGGEVVAFCLGEPMSKEMYVTHIEKAYSDVPGAYAIINQQFALHEAADYPLINREDAAGEPGLIQAKESYRPIKLLRKGVITPKS